MWQGSGTSSLCAWSRLYLALLIYQLFLSAIKASDKIPILIISEKIFPRS